MSRLMHVRGSLIPNGLTISRDTVGPVTLTLIAAVLFGFVNVAWRIGDEPVVVLAAGRALAGVVLFAPLAAKTMRNGSLVALFRDRTAWLAVVLSGVTLWTAAWVFHTVPGSLAAATVGICPVAALVGGALVGSRRIPLRAKAAVMGCSLFAVLASGPTDLTWRLIGIAGLFLVTDVASVVAAEKARYRHGPVVLTMAGLIVGAAPGVFLLGGVPASVDWATVVVVTVTIAGLGTLARLLRSQALGHLSASVVTGSTQVTALVVAIGGVIWFGETLSLGRLGALCVAGVCAVAALGWSVERVPART